MNWIALVEKLFSKSSSTTHGQGESVLAESLDVVRLLRSAGGALSAQVALHGKLAMVEWAEEKNRLIQMAAIMLLVFACSLCIMIFIGVLVLAISWDTPYRIHSVVGLIAVYLISIAIAWYRFKLLIELGKNTFAATREEIAADFALIRSKL